MMKCEAIARRVGLGLLACVTVVGLASCTNSAAPAPRSSAPSARSSTPQQTTAQPLRFTAISVRQNAALQKVVPLLGGVQSTAYNRPSKTLLVYVTADATTKQRAIIRSEVAKQKRRH